MRSVASRPLALRRRLAARLPATARTAATTPAASDNDGARSTKAWSPGPSGPEKGKEGTVDGHRVGRREAHEYRPARVAPARRKTHRRQAEQETGQPVGLREEAGVLRPQGRVRQDSEGEARGPRPGRGKPDCPARGEDHRERAEQERPAAGHGIGEGRGARSRRDEQRQGVARPEGDCVVLPHADDGGDRCERRGLGALGEGMVLKPLPAGAIASRRWPWGRSAGGEGGEARPRAGAPRRPSPGPPREG